jgi:hypothetical protein
VNSSVLLDGILGLLDGILGALPYLLLTGIFWSVSPVGVVLGLLLGQLHVWWRHTTALGWQTPKVIHWVCRILFITTPEQHWLHHQRPSIGYGDIFTIFEQPAKVWMRLLRILRVRFKYLFRTLPVQL